ncbi:Protein deglycase 3 [Porphyridium purpureum]|uniref:Protein deglycase 3 n=1 Tax=Porphyridium purpureum TaxID=35688 RepID=A0A5J4Z426_PORPP|nr:Protein deglycase 3 [Porphyridium purpureum]|eukprot:POR8453..scf295_1
MAPPTVLVPMATASEELEAIAIINILRRGGCDVTVACVEDSPSLSVKCARGVTVGCDAALSECTDKDWDAIILPGGMPGAKVLSQRTLLIGMLHAQKQAGKWYGAICAAPAVVLLEHGLLPTNATCHPGFEAKLIEQGVQGVQERVVVDVGTKCVTSRGAGTAIEFALKLVELLVSKEEADKVASAIVF